MVKAKWGTKRTCPKCGTRFYDLGKENPVVCIECGNEWVPEPILKSRQPQMEPEKKPEEPAAKANDDDDEDILKGKEIKIDSDIDIADDDAPKPDDNLDLDDGADVSDVIVKPKSGDES